MDSSSAINHNSLTFLLLTNSFMISGSNICEKDAYFPISMMRIWCRNWLEKAVLRKYTLLLEKKTTINTQLKPLANHICNNSTKESKV